MWRFVYKLANQLVEKIIILWPIIKKNCDLSKSEIIIYATRLWKKLYFRSNTSGKRCSTVKLCLEIFWFEIEIPDP